MSMNIVTFVCNLLFQPPRDPQRPPRSLPNSTSQLLRCNFFQIPPGMPAWLHILGPLGPGPAFFWAIGACLHQSSCRVGAHSLRPQPQTPKSCRTHFFCCFWTLAGVPRVSQSRCPKPVPIAPLALGAFAPQTPQKSASGLLGN